MTPASRSASVGWVMASPLTAVRSSERGVALHRRAPNTAFRYLSPGLHSCECHDSGCGQDVGMRSATMITSTDVAELGTIVGIWAHPDDEAYLSGGLMALARDNGQRVVCVTATRGELGTPDPAAWPPDRLAAERTRELANCLAVLGVGEHHWLGYGDGECAGVDPDAAAARLGDLIGDVRPDTVLTFGPDGITGHPDHCTV